MWKGRRGNNVGKSSIFLFILCGVNTMPAEQRVLQGNASAIKFKISDPFKLTAGSSYINSVFWTWKSILKVY